MPVLLVIAVLAIVGSLWLPEPNCAQSAAAVFKKVAPSVVVIRARGRDVSSSGLTSFTQIRQRLNSLAPGSPFKVSILRRGQLLELTGRIP